MADEKIINEEVVSTPSNFIYDFIDKDLEEGVYIEFKLVSHPSPTAIFISVTPRLSA